MGLKERSEFFLQLAQPERAVNKFRVSESAIDSNDIALAEHIMHSLRFRITSLGFLHHAPDNLPTQEQLGIILFTGLISGIDDVIDDKAFTISADKEELREDIMTATVVTHDRTLKQNGSIVTFNHILERTLAQFDQKKGVAITDFIDHAMDTELRFPNRTPGEYSYAEAVEYRRYTSEEYTRTVCQLLGLAPEETERIIISGNTYQILDDAMDIFPDHTTSAINPFIAYGYEHGEGCVIAQIAPSINGTFLNRMVKTKRSFEKIPQTYTHMRDVYAAMPRTASHSMLKRIGEALFL